MPTTPNAQLTKLAIGIASIAAVAGLAGRFAPNNPAPAPEADPAATENQQNPVFAQGPQQPAARQPQAAQAPARQPQTTAARPAAPATQVAQAPATQPLTQQQLEQQREAEQQRQELEEEQSKREREHEHDDDDEDEWEEEDDEEWEHGGGLFFWTQPAPAVQQNLPVDSSMPSFTDAGGQQWVQTDPGQAYVPVSPDGTVPVQQQPVTRTRSKHS